MADADFELSITLGESSFHASGSGETVMKALAEFKALMESSPRPKRQAQKKDDGDDGKSGDGGDDGGAKGKPLGVFVKRSWRNQAAKATAIILWARENDSKASLTPSEVVTYWRKTTGKTPANPGQVCQTAESQGWLHNEGHGRYTVTGHGVEMVAATPTS